MPTFILENDKAYPVSTRRGETYSIIGQNQYSYMVAATLPTRLEGGNMFAAEKLRMREPG
jgi:hypothetical protein